MPQIYFAVGAGVAALVVFFVIVSRAEEGYQDRDGFKRGKLPEDRSPLLEATAPEMLSKANVAAGSLGNE